MVSLILAKKIISLLLTLFMGVALVRCRILKPEDSKSLSVLSLYLIIPCLNLSAFQVEYTAQVRDGLIFTAIAALAAEGLMILAVEPLSRLLRLNAVEKTSAIYSNCGNMVIPIVSSVFGAEYVIYTMPYTCVQQFLFWSHCKMTICGDKRVELKKIFCNINMAAIFLGLIMLLAKVRFPELIDDAVSSVGDMVGPLSMIISGMLIGGMDIKKLLSYRRIWLVAAVRLLALPAMCLLIFKLCGMASFVANGETLLMITMLAASAPTAATVTQMAQVYGKDADYASACNVITTLLCAATMPVIMQLYYVM